MSNATFTFGRFQPPTEEGHGKLVSAVQQHAEKTGGEHYIFPSHSQDAKKNPMSHEDKVGAMKKLFPKANVVSHDKVRTAIDAMKHLESKGHKHVTMVVGSDRVDEFHGLLNKYREKEYPGIKKVSVVSAGNRDPDAEGAEGMSASKLRGLVASGKKDEFVSHYSNKKLGAEIHDKVKAGMEAAPKKKLKESVGIFLLGGPGSGKDYVLKNIFSRFDLTEVQIDQVLTGDAKPLFEQGMNVVINGGDLEKIQIAKSILEGYTFDHIFVSVTNKVSRERNLGLKQPLNESKRIDKYIKAQKMTEALNGVFTFNNSINLNESSEMERIIFAAQIEKLLERIVGLGLEMKEISETKTFQPKSFNSFNEQIKKPLTPEQKQAKYLKSERQRRVQDRQLHHQNSHIHAAAVGIHEDGLKDACWKGYEAVGFKKKNGKKVPNCVPIKEHIVKVGDKFRLVSRKTGKNLGTYDTRAGAENREREVAYFKNVKEATDDPIPLVLPKEKHAPVKRGYKPVLDVQRRNLEISKESGLIPEMQLVGTDEYREHAIEMTPGQDQEIEDATKDLEQTEIQSGCQCDSDCCCSACGDDNGRKTSSIRSEATRYAKKFEEIRKKKESNIIADPKLKTVRPNSTLSQPSQYKDIGMPIITGSPPTVFEE